MSILVRYNPASLTGEKYDEVSARVQESNWPPDGLDYHCCFGQDGDLKVSEIWDSQEQWQAHGEHLMPILADAGIEFAGDPEILPIHNIERPAR
jgi:hypothetical protein